MKYPECLKTINLELIDEFVSSNTHANLRCLECGDEFIATPKSKMANYKKSLLTGCPKCTKDKQFKTEKDNILKTIQELGFEIEGTFRSKLEYINARNTNCSCGRWWKTKPAYIKSGRSFCKPCNDDKKRERFAELNEERQISYDGSMNNYKTIVNRLTRIEYNKHFEIINPEHHERVRSDDDGYQLDHIVPIVTCYRYNVPPELCASHHNLRMVKRIDNAKKWSKPTETIPSIMMSYFSDINFLRTKITDFLDDKNITYEINKKIENISFSVAVGDVVIMICNFELFKEQALKSKKFLIDARIGAIENGYRPIFIFENEILSSTLFDIVKSRLFNLLKRNSNIIYARKCKILEVPVATKTKFLFDNHIQGATGSKHNYGLYYNDDLVAIMTFSNRREFLSVGTYNTKDDYELIRYVTKKNTTVTGGASKLFKHFIKTHNPRSIMSFSDMRWGSGGVYEKLEMVATHTTKPNYWYIVGSELEYRYTYKKHTLESKLNKFDINKSEYQNMLMNGYDRIWDCGSTVYLKLFE